jgi:glycerophosphoryl diester phosphodiesterase
MFVFGHGDEQPGNRINTLDSIDVVRRSGAGGIEGDLRASADHQVVVVHNHALPDGRLVAATSTRDLPSEIPSLGEFLDRARGLVVNLEIKNFAQDPAFDPAQGVTELTLTLLSRRDDGDQLLISCFGLACLDLIGERRPHLPTAVLLLSRRPAEVLLDEVVQHGHAIVHPYDTMVDPSFMAVARQRSLRVHVWLGQIDDQRMDQLIDLGVDGIITDAPARALQRVARRKVPRPPGAASLRPG